MRVKSSRSARNHLGHRVVRGTVTRAALVALILLAGLTGSAAASISATWATPAPVDHNSGPTLYGVACPSSSQCTAVDEKGQEVTFNPASPGTPAPVQVDSLVQPDRRIHGWGLVPQHHPVHRDRRGLRRRC